MSTAAWTVIALVWLVVLALVLVVLALARQIGVLHERLRPVGALQIAAGLKVGEAAPVIEVQILTRGSLANRQEQAGLSPVSGALPPQIASDQAAALQSSLKIGAARSTQRDTLLLFVSPTCPVCKTLLPSLKAIRRSERSVDVVLASDGSRLEHLDFIARESLEEFPYVLSEQLGIAFGAGRLPYAVLIDSLGIVRATGLVNTREQLDSLFEAKKQGVANIQEFSAGQSRA